MHRLYQKIYLGGLEQPHLTKKDRAKQFSEQYQKKTSLFRVCKGLPYSAI